jgi:hypothetical protein
MTLKLTPAQQIAALQGQIATLEAKVEATEKRASETHDMVQTMHDALMRPSPGQTKGLLDRLAVVAINFESGQRVAAWVVWIAGIIAAVGAIYAAVKLGLGDRG